MKSLAEQVSIVVIDGVRVAVVSQVIPDGASDELREGLARRAIVSAGGVCPCGTRVQVPNRATRRAAVKTGQVLDVRVHHENNCLATNEAIQSAYDAWVGGVTS